MLMQNQIFAVMNYFCVQAFKFWWQIRDILNFAALSQEVGVESRHSCVSKDKSKSTILVSLDLVSLSHFTSPKT